MRFAVLAALLVLAGQAWAEDLPLQVSDSMAEVVPIVFCSPPDEGVQVPAPDTELGYVLSTTADLPKPQVAQVVAASIGMSFGIRSVAARDMAEVRMVVTRPGGGKPDSWIETFVAGDARTDFFSFDFPREQVPGLWLMEAWEGEELLYRVGFTVLPEAAMPDMVAGCNAMS